MTIGSIHVEDAIEKAKSLLADDKNMSESTANAMQVILLLVQVKSNSKNKENIGFDKYLYKLRHIVENFFARIKEWRSINTRFERLKRNYAAMIELGCAYLWSKI